MKTFLSWKSFFPLAAFFALSLFSYKNCSAEEAVDVYEKLTHTYTGGEYENEEFGYRLMSPVEIKEGETYPLIFFLHGAGERGDDNELQLTHFPVLMGDEEHREAYPCFVLVPQCRKGEMWSTIHWEAELTATLDEEPSDQLKMAVEILDKTVEDYPIDTSRIYLTGLSMGGYGSYDLAMRRPNYFAAVGPVCGGGDLGKAETIAHLPIYIYHGAEDRGVPVARAREMVKALREADGEPLYKELPGVGHNSWIAAYNDEDGIVPWLFRQQRKE